MQELAHALGLSQPGHVIVEKALLPRLVESFSLGAGLPKRPQIHVWDTEPQDALLSLSGAQSLRIEEIIERGSADFEPARLPPGAARTETAFICFSSGTSGLVKGVRLSHGNVVANLFQQAQGLSGMFTSETVLTLIVPFFHILGLAGFCCQFISQVRVVPS